LEAAALAAHAHGRAAALGPSEGLMAGDIPDLLAKWLSTQRPSVQHLPMQHPGPGTVRDVRKIRHG
jgi:hypothetical protein